MHAQQVGQGRPAPALLLRPRASSPCCLLCPGGCVAIVSRSAQHRLHVQLLASLTRMLCCRLPLLALAALLMMGAAGVPCVCAMCVRSLLPAVR